MGSLKLTAPLLAAPLCMPTYRHVVCAGHLMQWCHVLQQLLPALLRQKNSSIVRVQRLRPPLARAVGDRRRTAAATAAAGSARATSEEAGGPPGASRAAVAGPAGLSHEPPQGDGSGRLTGGSGGLGAAWLRRRLHRPRPLRRQVVGHEAGAQRGAAAAAAGTGLGRRWSLLHGQWHWIRAELGGRPPLPVALLLLHRVACGPLPSCARFACACAVGCRGRGCEAAAEREGGLQGASRLAQRLLDLLRWGHVVGVAGVDSRREHTGADGGRLAHDSAGTLPVGAPTCQGERSGYSSSSVSCRASSAASACCCMLPSNAGRAICGGGGGMRR